LAMSKGAELMREALLDFIANHDEDQDSLRRDAGFNDWTGGCDCELCEQGRAAIRRYSEARRRPSHRRP
jgi:hypothetical protein